MELLARLSSFVRLRTAPAVSFHHCHPGAGVVSALEILSMFAFAHECPAETSSTPAWHAGFLRLLPAIRCQLRFALRKLAADERSEAMSECVAAISVTYAKLFKQGKADVAFASSLVTYALKQYFSGRRIGSRLNVNDVTSPYCQVQHGFRVRSLDQRAPDGQWRETLFEDRRSSPADLAAARIDIADWLNALPRLKRGIAEMLATGESTKQTASMFGVTPGRVSQIRSELTESWFDFQDEPLACV
jgi:hypothetical protein